jgi:predicted SprT family Zn-dependent metalloprotease
MTWLTSPATTRILDEMARAHQAYVAAEAKRAPFATACRCGQTAYRIGTIAEGEIGWYECDSCRRHFIDRARVACITEQG